MRFNFTLMCDLLRFGYKQIVSDMSSWRMQHMLFWLYSKKWPKQKLIKCRAGLLKVLLSRQLCLQMTIFSSSEVGDVSFQEELARRERSIPHEAIFVSKKVWKNCLCFKELHWSQQSCYGLSRCFCMVKVQTKWSILHKLIYWLYSIFLLWF